MKYQTRKGIVLTTVGDQPILVSAVSLHDQVPYVTNVNETAAFCWEILAGGADEEQLVSRVLEEFDVQDTEALRADIGGMLQSLFEKGYIVEV